MEFSVRVVSYNSDDEEEPVSGMTVMVFLNESIVSVESAEETTDDDGVASFDVDWDTTLHDIIHGTSLSVKIYVSKMDGLEFEVEEGNQITIPYDFD